MGGKFVAGQLVMTGAVIVLVRWLAGGTSLVGEV